MNSLVKSIDNLPQIVKIILCLPIINIIYAIYRICKGAETKNSLMLIVGILWIFFGSSILWIIDLICTILYKKPTILA